MKRTIMAYSSSYFHNKIKKKNIFLVLGKNMAFYAKSEKVKIYLIISQQFKTRQETHKITLFQSV